MSQPGPYLAFVLLMEACSPAKPSAATEHSPAASPEVTGTADSAASAAGDSEKQRPTAPVQVSGAFLVSCADVGKMGFACVAEDPISRKKAVIDSMAVTVSYTDQTSASLAPANAPDFDPWSIYFTVAASMVHQVASIQVYTVIDGVAQPVQVIEASAMAAKPMLAESIASTANILFLTRQTFQPGAAGFAGFDDMAATCTRLAAASTLLTSGAALTWVPLLSSNTRHGQAAPSLSQYLNHIVDAVMNTAGEIVAVDGEGFWQPHLAPAITDENGAYVGGDALVWSGSDATGRALGGNCNDWGVGGLADSQAFAAVGLAGSSTDWLQTAASAPCQSQQHVYCFGQR